MTDLVVTVPQGLWQDWLREGDLAGEAASGQGFAFTVGGGPGSAGPPCRYGDRLYVVAWGRLRGFAPVVQVRPAGRGWAIVRRGGAVAVTIDERVPGFQGWRARWWPRDAERPFPDWQTAGVGEAGAVAPGRAARGQGRLL
ncbi:MAG: hypothetical protein AB7F67_03945 [Rhodospirillaceae bacterium]